MYIAIIGGGAAGFFAAITAKETNPGARVVIYEKSEQVLAKVKISGGGRCNVTNGCDSIAELCSAYPRGGKALKKVFHQFNNKDTMQWFEKRGVPMIVQQDLRVFPKSGDSQSIIDCLVKESQNLGIEIRTNMGAKALMPVENQLEIDFDRKGHHPGRFDKIIVAAGGSPQRKGLEWLEKLGHRIEEPVPSLFTFNMPGEPVTNLMGLSADNAFVRIQGTNLKAEGPLLITHWGMSGPVILKLSSFGARILKDMNYRFRIQVNWAGDCNHESLLNQLYEISHLHPRKSMANFKPYNLPGRLWLLLLAKAEINENRSWGEIGRKGLNKMVSVLTNDVYEVKGQTTFRDEFVTCGGISLDSVDMTTMQSKVCDGLYFAGEVLDIDGITGGFNLQAAWTTGYAAGRACGVLRDEF